MQKRAGGEALPRAREEEITLAAENLDERAPTAGVRREFLTFGKGKQYDADLGRLQDGPADDSRRRELHGVSEPKRLGVVGREKGLLTHADSLTRWPALRLDAGQVSGEWLSQELG